MTISKSLRVLITLSTLIFICTSCRCTCTTGESERAEAAERAPTLKYCIDKVSKEIVTYCIKDREYIKIGYRRAVQTYIEDNKKTETVPTHCKCTSLTSYKRVNR